MKRLVLITDAFPWGRGEISFILPELSYLMKEYRVTVLSRSPMRLCKEGMDKVDLHEDIELLHYPELEDIPKMIKWGCLIPALLAKDFREEMYAIIKSKQGIHNLKQMYFFWIRANKLRKWMREQGLFNNLENTIFYSYWANYSVYSLAMEKRDNPTLRFVSRIHRYDLYNEYFPGGRQPFKRMVDAWIDKMVFIAREGLDYYIKNYTDNKEDCDKYVLCKLGVEEQAEKPEKKGSSFLRLVSCSAVNERKRVGLIVRALAELDEKVEWHHFGEGPEYDKTKSLADSLLGMKDNIQYEFHGFTPNEEIIKYYQKNYVDCFITTSANEGCPVSIQEAMSFGIPIIGTDVGEIRYMIDGNGVLLTADPTVQEVTATVSKVREMLEHSEEKMRERSLELWKRDYDIENNAKHFIEVLESCGR